MNTFLKRKFYRSLSCTIIGIIVLLYAALNNDTSKQLHDYLSGFGLAMIIVGALFMYRNIRGMKNPVRAQKMKNIDNDERLKAINYQAMSITLKISTFLMAILSIIFAFLKNEISTIFGLVVGAQLIIYVITYYFIVRKN